MLYQRLTSPFFCLELFKINDAYKSTTKCLQKLHVIDVIVRQERILMTSE